VRTAVGVAGFLVGVGTSAASVAVVRGDKPPAALSVALDVGEVGACPLSKPLGINLLPGRGLATLVGELGRGSGSALSVAVIRLHNATPKIISSAVPPTIRVNRNNGLPAKGSAIAGTP
jgi:hypothetical protein